MATSGLQADTAPGFDVFRRLPPSYRTSGRTDFGWNSGIFGGAEPGGKVAGTTRSCCTPKG